MSHPARKRTRARFGLTATHTGAHGVNHLASSLADILEVLLRAGFVPSTPGTPELCSSAYTLQVALCAQSAIRNLSNACRSIVGKSVDLYRYTCTSSTVDLYRYTCTSSTDPSRIDRHVRFNSGARWLATCPAPASLTKHFVPWLLGTSWVRGWYPNARIFEAVRFGRLK